MSNARSRNAICVRTERTDLGPLPSDRSRLALGPPEAKGTEADEHEIGRSCDGTWALVPSTAYGSMPTHLLDAFCIILTSTLHYFSARARRRPSPVCLSLNCEQTKVKGYSKNSSAQPRIYTTKVMCDALYGHTLATRHSSGGDETGGWLHTQHCSAVGARGPESSRSFAPAR